MKKTSTLWIALSVVALLTTTAIFGATTVPAIVTMMMDAQHDFTLASTLNPSQTGLKSSPLSGKSTGGVVTAEEYNRILEMLGQIQLTPILASGYVEGDKRDESISKEITIDSDGVIILAGMTRSEYREGCLGETTYTDAQTYIDDLKCSWDHAEVTDACNLSLSASSTCVRPITKGIHTIKVINVIKGNATERYGINMGYVVVGASPTTPTTTTTTTTTTSVSQPSYTEWCFTSSTYGTPVCPSTVTVGTQGPCDAGYVVKKSLGSWGTCFKDYCGNCHDGSGTFIFPPGTTCPSSYSSYTRGKAYLCG